MPKYANIIWITMAAVTYAPFGIRAKFGPVSCKLPFYNNQVGRHCRHSYPEINNWKWKSYHEIDVKQNMGNGRYIHKII